MDAATADFYSKNAPAVAARYESAVSAISNYFAVAFPSGSRVLDVGAGSGRDLAALIRGGFDAYGVEPIAELRAQACQHHPELTERLAAGQLPTLEAPFGGGFDGVLCSAVLMHVPEPELLDTALALRQLLRPHGRLLISLPLARTDVSDQNRDPFGRLFQDYAPDYLQLLFERLGFQRIGRWDGDDALGRAETRWYTLLFELRPGSGLRAVDQIEGILNRDRKVATYKLALFRALAELATQEPRCVSWRRDGSVGVPIGRIADRWLGYYWPIFASATFIPQSQSEGADAAKQLTFRRAMAELMAPYASMGQHGGLTAWQQIMQRGHLSHETRAKLAAALKSIAGAIRDGPVERSGGSLETGRVFTYDGPAAQIVMSADLWRELTLLGHWIIDAVVLRWASLTERFSQRQGIRSGDVLALLLARPEPLRATQIARQAFVSRGVDRCAWSDKLLRASFAVDHVIPFALWGNNDLWNLVPVDPAVNGSKSDKLPSAELLRSRQSSIVQSWRVLRDEVPEAFGLQASHLLGRPIDGPQKWEGDLFARLREAVELTALQRGVERWSPRVQPAKNSEIA